MKDFTCKSLLTVLMAGLLILPIQVSSDTPDTSNWVQKGSGLECSAFGVRADGTRSDPLTAVWQGDGVNGEPDRPTFKHIDETENGLNVVEFEKFDIGGSESRLAFEIEVFSKREEITLTVRQISSQTGTDETLGSDQLIVKKPDFVIGSNYVLELTISKGWDPRYYKPFQSYMIECRLDWLENN